MNLLFLFQSTLKKYRAFFGLMIAEDATKEELVRSISNHFSGNPRDLRDGQVIAKFLQENKDELASQS